MIPLIMFQHGHIEAVFQYLEQLLAKNMVVPTYHFMMLQLVLVIQMCLFHDVNVLPMQNGTIDTRFSVHQTSKSNSFSFFFII